MSSIIATYWCELRSSATQAVESPATQDSLCIFASRISKAASTIASVSCIQSQQACGETRKRKKGYANILQWHEHMKAQLLRRRRREMLSEARKS